MDQGAHFRVAHCSGERMKAEGADGASHGHLKEGVTAGMDMLSFIPLNETCLERYQTRTKIEGLVENLDGRWH
jgi:hypothetical protein